MHESITSKTFAETPEDLESRYPYQYWIPEDNCLILSKLILDGDTLSAGNGVLIKNPTTGAWVSTVTTTYYSLYTTSYSTGDFLRLYYNDVTGWEAWLPDQVRKTATNWTIYYSAYGSGTLPSAVYTNGVSLPSPFTSGGSTLPSDIPPFDNVEEAINNALNATTGTTTQANNITSNIQNQTQKFENGEINREVFELNINMALEVIDELQNTAGNTLADQIAINNALTATQTAQDKLITQDLIDALNEKFQWGLSDQITATDLINNIRSEVALIYTDYLDGVIPKDRAITQILEYQYNIELVKTTLIDQGLPWTTANESVFLGIKDFVAQTQDNINNSGDIDISISDSYVSSESEELELLDDMVSIMQTEQIDNPMEDQANINLGQTVKSNIEPVLNNKYISGLLALCTTFIIMCIILGTGYKFG